MLQQKVFQALSLYLALTLSTDDTYANHISYHILSLAYLSDNI